jgi:hypothetical protein
MSTQRIQVKVDLNGLRGRLSRSLQRTTLFVAAGLQNARPLEPAFPELPIDFKVQFDSGLTWSEEETRDQYSNWILSNGFRDVIESVSGVLEEAHQVLSVWQLRSMEQSGTRIYGSHWNTIVNAGGKKFHRLGLPEKLTHFNSEHNLLLDQIILDHVLSINKARNCLVHRDGIVAQLDLNSSRELQVTWRKLYYFVQDSDGERPLQIGARLEEGAKIGIRTIDTSKSFLTGDRIVFLVEEFAEICWSLFVFGEELISKLNTLGVQKGHLDAAEAAQPTA